jgi:hypothetical protein
MSVGCHCSPESVDGHRYVQWIGDIFHDWCATHNDLYGSSRGVGHTQRLHHERPRLVRARHGLDRHLDLRPLPHAGQELQEEVCGRNQPWAASAGALRVRLCRRRLCARAGARLKAPAVALRRLVQSRRGGPHAAAPDPNLPGALLLLSGRVPTASVVVVSSTRGGARGCAAAQVPSLRLQPRRLAPHGAGAHFLRGQVTSAEVQYCVAWSSASGAHVARFAQRWRSRR